MARKYPHTGGKVYPVPFDFEAHQKSLRDSSLALWKQYIRNRKEQQHDH